MKRLLNIYNKSSRIVLGLMSGTSHDGVDAAIAKITRSSLDSKVRLIHHEHSSYPSTLKNRIAAASDSKASDICMMNFEIGDFFAKAALSCISGSGLSSGDIDLIASHGQTIYHSPPELNRRGFTLQIGESSIIAYKTGIPVVSDFRPADMARNGHGAPLVPFADYILFHKKGKVRAAQNIGGIANVTVVTPGINEVFAFDTGPGNSLINGAMHLLFKKSYDKNGMIARSGEPDSSILKELMAHPYFSKKPPKSTGRETFGLNLINTIASRKRIRPEDLIATLTYFTALSIKNAYDRFILKKYKLSEIILSGGGSRNSYLVSLLKELFNPILVATSDSYGIPAMAKEALCFAILANETISGRPSNLPQVTGASGSAILGKITLH
ncbi:MAG: anhydro-N-acetylmuramic acid kinase [Nitrospirota bacterium]